ncbi:MAG: transketolase, partial [Clostridiaceae bacterium]|nr:transketolase [Clostridiaceae bacterium]
MDGSTRLELTKTATKIRMGIITATASAGSGHPGGSLSLTDILTYLYFKEMRIDTNNPKDPDRDRFVLSKGHCTPGLYATLAYRGFFPVEDLSTFRQIDSYLEGHPNMDKVPGVDMSTGSLGQGISAAVGMALAGKIDKKGYRVFAVLGDGE